LNSSVVYNSIRNHLHSAHELEQKLFIQLCSVKNFALGFATKTGTAATFSITLVSNFVLEKLLSGLFIHDVYR
jgi:hypothetical protein